mmetsp:Transcript_10335/g.42038  ORF Transcript_10335/g.42038 Transcript_10335/m.42038 type:complete len:324 (-) Transcript_10335:2315-3286(-)
MRTPAVQYSESVYGRARRRNVQKLRTSWRGSREVPEANGAARLRLECGGEGCVARRRRAGARDRRGSARSAEERADVLLPQPPLLRRWLPRLLHRGGDECLGHVEAGGDLEERRVGHVLCLHASNGSDWRGRGEHLLDAPLLSCAPLRFACPRQPPRALLLHLLLLHDHLLRLRLQLLLLHLLHLLHWRGRGLLLILFLHGLLLLGGRRLLLCLCHLLVLFDCLRHRRLLLLRLLDGYGCLLCLEECGGGGSGGGGGGPGRGHAWHCAEEGVLELELCLLALRCVAEGHPAVGEEEVLGLALHHAEDDRLVRVDVGELAHPLL